ncbi:MAG: PD-(D/E)XK nuclease family protein, partial [Myxococcota bacterium]
ALEALLIGYHLRWTKVMDDFEVLAVEAPFEGPLVHPLTGQVFKGVKVGGKIDAIVRWRGKVYLVEHKTTSRDASPGSSYRTMLRMNPQVSLYHLGAQWLGYDIEGCIFDVAKRPQQKPYKATANPEKTKGKRCTPCKKLDAPDPTCEVCQGSGWKEEPRLKKGHRLADETPDEYRNRVAEDIGQASENYYQRIDVVRLEDELIEARLDLWRAAELITASSRFGSPRNPYACFQFHSACEYFDVCGGTASIEDPRRFRLTDRYGKRMPQ